MIKVFEMEMELSVEGNELGVEMSGGVSDRISDILTGTELEEIKELSKKMSRIIGGAVARDLQAKPERETLSKILDKRKEEIYAKMSDEDKKMVDEVERQMSNAKNPEEQLDILLGAIKEAIIQGR